MERELARGLAKDPRDRPRSATALVDALEAALPRPDATVPYAAVAAQGTRSPRRRGAGIAALAASAAVLVGGAVGAWALMGGQGTEAAVVDTRPPLPPVPTADGEVVGRDAPEGAVPGTTRADRVAATSIDGATAYAIRAGLGRTPEAVAGAVAAGLADSGLLVDRLDVAGDGSMALAHSVTDFLMRGDTWAVAQVPGARASDPDRVLVVRGTGGTPARVVDALSAARPASVVAPE